MPLRSRRTAARMPEIDMIPMLGVMLVVLAFFVLITTTLNSQQTPNLSLPTAQTGIGTVAAAQPLIVTLNQQESLTLADKPVTLAELSAALLAFFEANPKGTVVLKADRQLPYQKVLPILETLKAIGGDRVSLAISSP